MWWNTYTYRFKELSDPQAEYTQISLFPVKLLETKDQKKKKILKAARENWCITYKEMT